MCGIVGVINLSQKMAPITSHLMETMGEIIQHRGPDGFGTWVNDDGTVGLHHRRLSIVDLSSSGAQPMPNEDGKIQSVVNGEIYNFSELRTDLETKGHSFRSHTDIEVIPHLYEEHGDKAVEMLDGDFAYGIWDSDKKLLTLARDRAGVKPLYWTVQNDVFIFASEIKAILEHPLIDAELNKKGFYDYLTYLVVPAPDTLFKGIHKLCIGQTLKLDLSAKNPEPITSYFYRPLPKREVKEPSVDLDQLVDDLFEKSVLKRKMSDVPVGVLFSSGVDSTMITLSFSEHGKEKVRSYTVGVEGKYSDFDDDYNRAKIAAKRLELEHNDIVISDNDLIEMAEKIIWHMDEPIADPVSIPLYFVTKLAKDNGTTVVQAGEGADELFLGYNKYQVSKQHYEKYWPKLNYIPKPLLKLLAWSTSKVNHPLADKVADIIRRKAEGLEFFVSSAVGYYELEKRNILSSSFKKEFADYDSSHAMQPLYDELKTAIKDPTIFEIISFFELNVRLPELLLMRADKLSMANSVEIRVPFLDRDIVDFALTLHEDYCIKDKQGKAPLKRSLARDMNDDAYVYRKKSGFGLPVHEFFKGALGKKLASLIKEEREDLEKILDCDELLNSISRKPRSVNEGFQLWQIYNFILWKQIFDVKI